MSQNALIYCRVSTEEQAQEGFSLDAQEKFCRNFADQNGFRIAGVYRDEGKSGTTLDRPALKDLLEYCQQENKVGAVLVQETDRLARNTKDHLTIKAMLQKAEVRLVSVAQPMLDDSPEGNMIDTILASVNQFQSDINSRKTKKGLQERFDEGWWPGWVPLGYLNVPVDESHGGRKAKKIVVEDPDRWTLIQQGFKLYLTGNYSVDEINDILYRKGLKSKSDKKVAHSIMTNTLKHPFYAGIMKWNGQEKVGKHKPMISLQDHKRILQIMASHNLHACRRRKHSFALKGFVFCNICGKRYTAEKHPKKNKEYYHCTTKKEHSNRGQNIEVGVLESQVEKYFEQMQFSQEFIDMVVTKVKKLYHQRKGTIDKEKQTLYNQKIAIEKKRDVIEAKLLDGVISDDDFVRMRSKFKADLDQIQNKFDDLEAQRDYDISVIEEVLKLSRNIYKAYIQAPFELKRQYLSIFWEKFLVQDRMIVEAMPTFLMKELIELRHMSFGDAQTKNPQFEGDSGTSEEVIIRHEWLPSPLADRTLKRVLENWDYIAGLREKLAVAKRLRYSMKSIA